MWQRFYGSAFGRIITHVHLFALACVFTAAWQRTLSAALLDVATIPESGVNILFVDLEAIRNGRIGEMFRGSESFQDEFGKLPIGRTEVHGAVRSFLGTVGESGSTRVMITVEGSAKEWFERFAGDLPRETTQSGLLKFNDSNGFNRRLLGQIGRFKEEGQLYVAFDGHRAIFGGTGEGVTEWMTQLKDGRRAAWIGKTELTESPVLCVRRSTEKPAGLSHVSIDTEGEEIRVRVTYHANANAKSGLLPMLQPEVLTTMLNAMQQQSEAMKAKTKREATEIASKQRKRGDAALERDVRRNTLNIALGFKGDGGVSEAIRFLRSTFDVETEGLKIMVQWQGRLALNFDHAVGEQHLYSFQFTSDPAKQLEVAGRKRDVK